ncbi:MAG: VOC family protein [Pseudohongiellaceae bacterium]
MFSHVMVGANDLEASRKFYDAALVALGHKEAGQDPKGRYFWRSPAGVFGITTPLNSEPACHANGGTIGFAADNTDAVDAWFAAGLANGGSECEDPPGIRENNGRQLYIAYLRDPSGNKVCAMHRVK